uniref:Uncharacterized protein n=1 Tax=Nelumbo nucifera TaxID=4432 RepID=A0A822YAF8_NELNU|nr:TPA_asm: hypothetical protein HUJ06_029454 [Nelumbo nucifera]
MSPSSLQADRTSPTNACLEVVYERGAEPLKAAATVSVQTIEPHIFLSTIARLACLIIDATPLTFMNMPFIPNTVFIRGGKLRSIPTSNLKEHRGEERRLFTRRLNERPRRSSVMRERKVQF